MEEQLGLMVFHWRSEWLVLQLVFHTEVTVRPKLNAHTSSCLLDTTFEVFLLLWLAVSALIFCDVVYLIVGQALERLPIEMDLMNLEAASSRFLEEIQQVVMCPVEGTVGLVVRGPVSVFVVSFSSVWYGTVPVFRGYSV